MWAISCASRARSVAGSSVVRVTSVRTSRTRHGACGVTSAPITSASTTPYAAAHPSSGPRHSFAAVRRGSSAPDTPARWDAGSS